MSPILAFVPSSSNGSLPSVSVDHPLIGAHGARVIIPQSHSPSVDIKVTPKQAQSTPVVSAMATSLNPTLALKDSTDKANRNQSESKSLSQSQPKQIRQQKENKQQPQINSSQSVQKQFSPRHTRSKSGPKRSGKQQPVVPGIVTTVM